MLTNSFSATLAGAIFSVACLVTVPAQALSRVTYVSGRGTDSGTCASPANPCRSFQFAHDQTSRGGEIKALDPAHYGGVVITKSISITAIEGAGIHRAAGGDAVTIDAGPADAVTLDHLTIDGANKAAFRGIVLESAGSLTITHCVVRSVQVQGILLQPRGTTRFMIADTLVSETGEGILVAPKENGSARGTLDRVTATRNGFSGINITAFKAGASADVTAIDTIADDNDGIGFAAQAAAVLRLVRSTATRNKGPGVIVNHRVFSSGDNFIHANDPDLQDGPLVPIGTQ